MEINLNDNLEQYEKIFSSNSKIHIKSFSRFVWKYYPIKTSLFDYLYKCDNITELIMSQEIYTSHNNSCSLSSNKIIVKIPPNVTTLTIFNDKTMLRLNNFIFNEKLENITFEICRDLVCNIAYTIDKIVENVELQYCYQLKKINIVISSNNVYDLFSVDDYKLYDENDLLKYIKTKMQEMKLPYGCLVNVVKQISI